MSNGRTFSLDALESRILLSGTRVVGYLQDSEVSRGLLKHLDWSALTQINYFCIDPNAGTGKLPAGDTSVFTPSRLAQVVRAAHQHDVKVSIVVGQAGAGDESLSAIAASGALRTAFARSVRNFAAQYDLDGVDLDWEPPNPTSRQITNFGKLIAALSAGTRGLFLSAAVSPEKLPIAPDDTTTQFVLSPQAVEDLDSIGVMAYDVDDPYHAPLKRSTHDMQAWAKYLESEGVSRTKLLLGIPFFGRAGPTWNDSWVEGYGSIVNHYIAQSGLSPSPSAGALTASFGSDVFNNAAVTWYIDGPTVIASQTTYALDNGFGGVMVWTLGQDHYSSTGGYDQYSLLPVVAKTVAAQ